MCYSKILIDLISARRKVHSKFWSFIEKFGNKLLLPTNFQQLTSPPFNFDLQKVCSSLWKHLRKRHRVIVRRPKRKKNMLFRFGFFILSTFKCTVYVRRGEAFFDFMLRSETENCHYTVNVFGKSADKFHTNKMKNAFFATYRLLCIVLCMFFHYYTIASFS